MMRPAMRNLALSSVATLLLVGGGWVWLRDSSAAASTSFPLPGQEQSCDLDRDHEIALNLNRVKTFSTGSIQARVDKTSKTTDGRQTAELTVLRTFTRGTAEGIGEMSIENDQARTTPPSTLTSNLPDRSFPATQMMRFHPVITINGETFRTSAASDPATLVNTSIPSFPAPAGTVYVLANPLTLQSTQGNTIDIKAGETVKITGSSSF